MDKKAAIVPTRPVEPNARTLALLGERAFGQTLQGLLSLTSDACLAFDGFGRIIMASDAAAALWTKRRQASYLVGADIRSLFPPAQGVLPKAPFSLDSLPFTADGVAKHVIIQAADGEAVSLDVRLIRLTGPGDTYLCVCRIVDANSAAQRERDRLVSELERANMRLYGTLRIVLDTINAEDTQSLFQNVLDELQHTMGATGVLLYVAHSDGFHLTGLSKGIEDVRAARFMPYGKTLELLISEARRTVRLRQLLPTQAELRQGASKTVQVLDEDSNVCHAILRHLLPPFTNFMVVPIYFGAQMLALIELGWAHAHPTRREDADLLDTVAQYLSIQLVGAFSAMQERYLEQLATLRSECTSKLMAKDTIGPADVEEILQKIADHLECDLYRIEIKEGVLLANLLESGATELILDPALGDVFATLQTGEAKELCQSFIAEDVLFFATRGAFATKAHTTKDDCLGWALVRAQDLEPFDVMEIDLVRGLADDVLRLLAGAHEHTQTKHIAQALQTGMKNELQQVAGIAASAIYSSATEQAAVGGDFYDLIRLPNHKACVIMGDVSGKGVEAASVSAAVKTALGAYAWQGIAPHVMVSHLNDFLLGFSRLETFATLFVGMIDIKNQRLSYCSAGHPPAIIIRAQTGQQETLDVQSGVVGAFSEMRYRTGTIALTPRDTLLLYTDGTTEARGVHGGFFGEDGLKDVVANYVATGETLPLTNYILDALDRFTGRSLDDDVALLSLTFEGI